MTVLDNKLVEAQLRTQICQCCKFRSHKAGACEAKCPLFQHLDLLREIAIFRDPMLATDRQSIDRALGPSIRQGPQARQAVDLIRTIAARERRRQFKRTTEVI